MRGLNFNFPARNKEKKTKEKSLKINQIAIFTRD